MSTHQLKRSGVKRRVRPEDLLSYQQGVYEPYEFVAAPQPPPPPQRPRELTVLFVTLQKTVLWLLNYLVVSSITRKIAKAQPQRKQEATVVTLFVLIFSFGIIETTTGRNILILFLALIYFLISQEDD